METRYLETYYGRPMTYGGRQFIMVDYDKGIFTTVNLTLVVVIIKLAQPRKRTWKSHNLRIL